MQISPQKVVVIEYTLKNDDGEVIDTSVGGEPLSYLHGTGNIIPGLESELEGKKAGDAVKVRVNPEMGYGERDDDKQQEVPREMFGEQDIPVGAQFHAADPEGRNIVVTVMEVDDDKVIVDGNHPLAGIHLNFDVKIIEVREASEEELSHGHVHGPGGHHHD